jgi:hypothetical protein
MTGGSRNYEHIKMPWMSDAFRATAIIMTGIGNIF